MTDLYLIDKSALARVPRHATVMGALQSLDERGTLATSPVVDLEIGFSARNLAEFDSVDADRRALYRELALNHSITNRARWVQRELVVRGHHRAVGIADLLIAATAEFHRAVVVHYDRDFDLIAEVTGQSVQWIVPAGSVP
ncbi:PIN domain nuclease [Nocardia sp. CC227C]|uniref:PIN domain nuclease n=1 Tax=Nocardia sp. CC227C TaxID=3044562 RepID=UPI00278C20A0|nr:PIN domain nuclease [Nocardia sp. CC227C]